MPPDTVAVNVTELPGVIVEGVKVKLAVSVGAVTATVWEFVAAF